MNSTENIFGKGTKNLNEVILEKILKLPETSSFIFEVPTEDEDNTNSAIVEYY